MAWRGLLSFGRLWASFQGGTRQVDPAAYTIKSHGATLARNHMLDWLILVLLIVIEVVLFVIHPFHRFVGRDMMEDLKYPMKDNSVPVWAVPVYDKWGGVVCHGKGSDIKEGHKSFPSGHTSWSFAGLGFLSLYLSGKIKAFDRRGHVAKLCIVFLPLLVACLVGISRVDDYWHHWQDVFAGGLLGLVVATFCYMQFFPAPYSDDGWGPYAYFKAMEESQANSNMNRESPAVQPMGEQVMTQIPRRTGETVIPFTYNSPTLEAMELGQK